MILHRLMLTATAVLAISLTPIASAQVDVSPATSSADAVKYAQAAAATPMGTTATAQRSAAMKFVENDHQTHVLLCQQIFQQMTGNHSAHASEITMQYMISAAAFLYQHAEANGNSTTQNVAGLDAAANVYKAFVSIDPKTHSKFLDAVVKQQAAGSLIDFVTKTCK